MKISNQKNKKEEKKQLKVPNFQENRAKKTSQTPSKINQKSFKIIQKILQLSLTILSKTTQNPLQTSKKSKQKKNHSIIHPF